MFRRALPRAVVQGESALIAKDSRKGQARAPVQRKPATPDEIAGGNVGTALRSVYDQTVGEAVPDEMLDLLGKLA